MAYICANSLYLKQRVGWHVAALHAHGSGSQTNATSPNGMAYICTYHPYLKQRVGWHVAALHAHGSGRHRLTSRTHGAGGRAGAGATPGP
eukprot:1160891-Pelagomonas_calceolata.AAC.7